MPVERPRALGRRLARRLLQIAGGGVVAMTLMACYGAGAYYDPCWDNDGDGYFPACYTETCDPQDRYCDCDDLDPGVYPDAPDVFGDGTDQNCDGIDGPAPK